MSRSPLSSRDDAARCACARKTPSQNPGPSASIEISQSRKDAASPISPASTAHSMPLEYEKAPTGNDGDSQVISRYSAAASLSCIPLRPSGAGAAASLAVSSIMASARTTARRRGRAGLLVVMSMGMAVVMVVIAMLVMVMTVVMMMVIVVVLTGVIMARVVMGMIMRRVVVRLAFRRVRVAAVGIGATFGIERRLDLDYARAQSLHH